ncbi:MAG TPA: hypothetical protein VFV50_17395 [Bdellovibrionales bacterium]|nr:hypothetical protein [Bdellovibrionales bacterium]
MKTRRVLASLFVVVFASFGCTDSYNDNEGGPPPVDNPNNTPQVEKTYLGFTPLPPSVNPADQDLIYSRMATNSNIVAHHFDNGIPWNEALANTYPYHSNIMNDWSARKTKTPAGHKVYVAVTPIDGPRSGLALYRKESDNMTLTAPFDTHAAYFDFNHADVRAAYLNYCRRVIQYFNPDYFAIGIEVNLLRKNTPGAWASYLALQQYIYQQLKSEFPELPIFASVVGAILLHGYEDYTAEFAGQADPATAYMNAMRAALDQVLQSSDYYALSFYPYATIYYNQPFPSDMIPTLFSLSNKPLVIAETGILAKDLNLLGLTFIGTEARQRGYFETLIQAVKARKGRFIINFVMQDYDQLCVDISCPDIYKVWIHTGFYSATGAERSVLQYWKQNL